MFLTPLFSPTLGSCRSGHHLESVSIHCKTSRTTLCSNLRCGARKSMRQRVDRRSDDTISKLRTCPITRHLWETRKRVWYLQIAKDAPIFRSQNFSLQLTPCHTVEMVNKNWLCLLMFAGLAMPMSGCSTSGLNPNPIPSPIPTIPQYYNLKNLSLVALYVNSGWTVFTPTDGLVQINLNTTPDPVTIATVCEYATLNGPWVLTNFIKASRNRFKELLISYGTDFVFDCHAQPITPPVTPAPPTTTITVSVAGLNGSWESRIRSPPARVKFTAANPSQTITTVENAQFLSTMLYFKSATDKLPSQFERQEFTAKANTKIAFDQAKARDFPTVSFNLSQGPNSDETGNLSLGTGVFPTTTKTSSETTLGSLPITSSDNMSLPLLPMDALIPGELQWVGGSLTGGNTATNRSTTRSASYYFRSPTLYSLEIPRCTSNLERVAGLAYGLTTSLATSKIQINTFSGSQSSNGLSKVVGIGVYDSNALGTQPIVQLTNLPNWKSIWNFDSNPISSFSYVSGGTNPSVSGGQIKFLPVDGGSSWGCSIQEQLQ